MVVDGGSGMAGLPLLLEMMVVLAVGSARMSSERWWSAVLSAVCGLRAWCCCREMMQRLLCCAVLCYAMLCLLDSDSAMLSGRCCAPGR